MSEFKFGKPGEFDVRYDALMVDPTPEPNFVLRLGEPELDIKIAFRVKRTWLNRAKWWVFCRVFPFTVEEWK